MLKGQADGTDLTAYENIYNFSSLSDFCMFLTPLI